MLHTRPCLCFFFFNDTATTEIYTLSLHDALPIFIVELAGEKDPARAKSIIQRTAFLEFRITDMKNLFRDALPEIDKARSEEHTSELQSQSNLVCRLLLEKKKTIKVIQLDRH